MSIIASIASIFVSIVAIVVSVRYASAERPAARAGLVLAEIHPDLQAWMNRPLGARLIDPDRTKTWPLVTRAILTGRVVPDLELLASRPLGGLHLAAKHCMPMATPGCGRLPRD